MFKIKELKKVDDLKMVEKVKIINLIYKDVFDHSIAVLDKDVSATEFIDKVIELFKNKYNVNIKQKDVRFTIQYIYLNNINSDQIMGALYINDIIEEKQHDDYSYNGKYGKTNVNYSVVKEFVNKKTED